MPPPFAIFAAIFSFRHFFIPRQMPYFHTHVLSAPLLLRRFAACHARLLIAGFTLLL
jgi:hypothetical protein